MPIAREGYYFVSQDLTDVPSIGIESANLDGCIREAKVHPYKSVFGSPAFGFFEESLDALGELPHLEYVWFWDIVLKNIEAVYALSELKSFGIHDKRPAIDFSRLNSLRKMVWIYKSTDIGISSLQLERLHVWHYSAKSKSFAGLQIPNTLTELEINWANPRTLEGLMPMNGLRRLQIHRCRNLESLAILPDLFPKLEHLVVGACGRIGSGEGGRLAAAMPSLTHAFVNGKKLV
jgi:hypothetical protein